MTTLQRHANGDGKHKVIVLSAHFQGNTANNLSDTSSQISTLMPKGWLMKLMVNLI